MTTSLPLFLEIGSVVDENRGVSTKTGKPYYICRQEAYLHVGRTYPERFDVSLKEDQSPFPPGLYLLTGDAVVERQGYKQLTDRFIPIPFEKGLDMLRQKFSAFRGNSESGGAGRSGVKG